MHEQPAPVQGRKLESRQANPEQQAVLAEQAWPDPEHDAAEQMPLMQAPPAQQSLLVVQTVSSV